MLVTKWYILKCSYHYKTYLIIPIIKIDIIEFYYLTILLFGMRLENWKGGNWKLKIEKRCEGPACLPNNSIS